MPNSEKPVVSRAAAASQCIGARHRSQRLRAAIFCIVLTHLFVVTQGAVYCGSGGCMASLPGSCSKSHTCVGGASMSCSSCTGCNMARCVSGGSGTGCTGGCTIGNGCAAGKYLGELRLIRRSLSNYTKDNLKATARLTPIYLHLLRHNNIQGLQIRLAQAAPPASTGAPRARHLQPAQVSG